MSVVLQHALQEYGTGDEIDLALTQYGGSIIEGYYDNLVMGRHVWSMPISSGSTYQFPASAKATASDVTPGVLRTGANQPEMEARTVSLDLQEIESDRYESLTDQFIKHFDTTALYGRASGQAVAQTVEDRLFRALVIGARMAARGTGADEFPAGSSVQSDTTTSTTDIKANYPRSLTGSLALQGDLEKLAVTMDEKNVPRGQRVVFLSPYLCSVLLQDKTLVSRDYQGVNDMLTRKMVEVQGFMVEMTNRLPAADDRTNTAYPSQYRVATAALDNYYTVALAVGAPDAVGQVTALGGVRPVNPVWYDNMNAWYLGAKIWQGAKWLRPEACGEIRLS